ncbi:MAG: Unknown protein [uncultured Sulfurovum sp.]|uniref:BON domain-containing protein n=1 Tax=uncultured Sulfurovum sp. TaxID=269237 RepID=A0A6S6RVV8_9BACT|nr:MAG: Unknown protein [uncultured Sulfurovum sp.]
MKKILQILLGFLLILVLAYFSFLEISGKIKDDLLSKTKNKLIDKGIVGINAEVEGEGLALRRTVVLTGTVGSEKEKSKIVSFMEELEGVGSVNNKILVEARVYGIPNVVEVPVVKKVKAVVPVAKVAVKSVVLAEKNEVNATKTAEVLPSVPAVKAVTEPISVIEVKRQETVPSQVVVKVPTVPVVAENIIEVPKVIEVITVPIPVEAEKAIVHEEVKKNIKTQGVE